MVIAIINGPNINMLGIREPKHYGYKTWDSIEKELILLSDEIGVELMFYQSNHEGNIVDFIQINGCSLDGVLINPAAFTCSGYSIIDALESVKKPFVEIHISNIFKRAGWHEKSIFSEYAVGTISGFLGYSYTLGLYSIINHLKEANNEQIGN